MLNKHDNCKNNDCNLQKKIIKNVEMCRKINVYKYVKNVDL